MPTAEIVWNSFIISWVFVRLLLNSVLGHSFTSRSYAARVSVSGFGDGKYVSFEERQWHQPCFKCSRCSVSLVGSGFFPDRDLILCTDCNSDEWLSVEHWPLKRAAGKLRNLGCLHMNAAVDSRLSILSSNHSSAPWDLWIKNQTHTRHRRLNADVCVCKVPLLFPLFSHCCHVVSKLCNFLFTFTVVHVIIIKKVNET